MTDLNPQLKQMADESMARTLEAQARAIWPQEVPLVRRYGLGPDIRILDAGCGTGEITSRLAEMFPLARVLGVDVLDHRVATARERYARLSPRLSFERQSVFGLRADDGAYDLTVCRHVLHSIPHPERVIAELKRVTRRGGWLHLIPEDYGMLHFPAGVPDLGEFWHQVAVGYAEKTGTDLFVGRHAPAMLADLGLEDVTADYVIVDSLRVPRPTFAAIFEAWRDGYVEPLSEMSGRSPAHVRACFERMIADVRDPRRYAAWMVPVVAGRVR